MKIISNVVKYAIRWAKKSKYIQNIFESPFEIEKYPKMGVFFDSKENQYVLRDGIRSKLRPGWHKMAAKPKLKTERGKEFYSNLKKNSSILVSKLEGIVNSQGLKMEECRVLDVGCHAGGTSFELISRGAMAVDASDFSGYKVESVNSSKGESKTLEKANDELVNMRSSLGKLYSQGQKEVRFIDDDICNTTLQPDSYDLICSWDVLEHLHQPEKALSSMHKLLKKDGVMVHMYNPFFALNGGHSLCTLDFLWGHVQLDEKDFKKYLKQYRPTEYDRAVSFYENGLNRMTISDLTRHLKELNFKNVAVLPFTKEQHLRMVDASILQHCKENYANLNMLDLTAPIICVIAHK